jgi:hypothetical protein
VCRLKTPRLVGPVAHATLRHPMRRLIPPWATRFTET